MERVAVATERERRNLRNRPLCIPDTGRFPLHTAPWLDLPVMCVTKQKTNAVIKVLNSSSDSSTAYKEVGSLRGWQPGCTGCGTDGIPGVAKCIFPGDMLMNSEVCHEVRA